jgi:hypothetical protein
MNHSTEHKRGMEDRSTNVALVTKPATKAAIQEEGPAIQIKGALISI